MSTPTQVKYKFHRNDIKDLTAYVRQGLLGDEFLRRIDTAAKIFVDANTRNYSDEYAGENIRYAETEYDLPDSGIPNPKINYEQKSELYDFCQKIVGKDGLTSAQFAEISKKYGLDAIGNFSAFDTNAVAKDAVENRKAISRLVDDVYASRSEMSGAELSKALQAVMKERDLNLNFTINIKDAEWQNPSNVYNQYSYTKEQAIELLIKENNFTKGDGVVTGDEMFSELSLFFNNLSGALKQARQDDRESLIAKTETLPIPTKKELTEEEKQEMFDEINEEEQKGFVPAKATVNYYPQQPIPISPPTKP